MRNVTLQASSDGERHSQFPVKRHLRVRFITKAPLSLTSPGIFLSCQLVTRSFQNIIVKINGGQTKSNNEDYFSFIGFVSNKYLAFV